MWFKKKSKDESCTIISKGTNFTGEVNCINKDTTLFIEGGLTTKGIVCDSVNVSGTLKSLGDTCDIKYLEVSGEVLFNDIETEIDTLILKNKGKVVNFKKLTVKNLIIEGECLLSGERIIYNSIKVAQKAKLNVRMTQIDTCTPEKHVTEEVKDSVE